MFFVAGSTGAVSRSEQPKGAAGRQQWEPASREGKEGIPAASQLPPGPPWHRLALERALPATTWKLPGLKVHVSYLIFQCSAVLKVLRLDHMQWPSHPFTPTASDSAEIPTRFLSALPATPWQGLTEGKERDRAAEMHKLRINFERENMLHYHSLHASVKPRKK